MVRHFKKINQRRPTTIAHRTYSKPLTNTNITKKVQKITVIRTHKMKLFEINNQNGHKLVKNRKNSTIKMLENTPLLGSRLFSLSTNEMPNQTNRI